MRVASAVLTFSSQKINYIENVVFYAFFREDNQYFADALRHIFQFAAPRHVFSADIYLHFINIYKKIKFLYKATQIQLKKKWLFQVSLICVHYTIHIN